MPTIGPPHMPAHKRRTLAEAELRQPRYPKPHIQIGRDGYWYLVNLDGQSWRQREPIAQASLTRLDR